jgi:hypothetical protein
LKQKILTRRVEMKNKIYIRASLLSILFAFSGLSASAYAGNVALGSNITLNGTFYTDGGSWGSGNILPTSTVVNGIFVPEETQWNLAGIWWNGSDNPNNNFVINLGGQFSITSFQVQADDNDTYRISYLSGANWIDAYDVPQDPSWGLVTRPLYTLNTPIITSELMVTATSGDGYYSVSQVVANGTAVNATPEPATMALFGVGLVGLAGFVRRKRS